MSQLDRTFDVYASQDEATSAAAALFEQLARQAVSARGSFSVALSGGHTPAGLYEKLGGQRPPAKSQGEASGISWTQIELYFGDERCVPPDDPESNYRMVRETLVDKIPIPAENVHRIEAERPPAEAAAAYEQTLRSQFGLGERELPRFDFILLGMGPDGHTASLFPNTAGLAERSKLVIANYVPQLATDRITLTLPVLNNARCLAFLIAGEDKAEALAAVFEGPRDPSRYPAQSIQPVDGRLIWLLDRPAASKLGPPFV
jgi:6-phosphogluconolactonase